MWNKLKLSLKQFSSILNLETDFKINIFIFRDRDQARRGRERGRQNPKQALHLQHKAWCRAQTHELWDHELSRSWMLNQLSLPGASYPLILKTTLIIHCIPMWTCVCFWTPFSPAIFLVLFKIPYHFNCYGFTVWFDFLE